MATYALSFIVSFIIIIFSMRVYDNWKYNDERIFKKARKTVMKQNKYITKELKR